MSDQHCRLAPLPSLGLIAATGADASTFLAAQLSQRPPDAEHAPLAGWHDAKGRVQALFRVLRRDDGFLLLTHRSVVDDVAAGLRRYVLRSDLALERATDDLAALALLGDADAWLARSGLELAAQRGSTARADEARWLRIGPGLVYVIAAAQPLAALAESLPRATGNDAEVAAIRLGEPLVSEALRGQFLPQMLNLDVLGGVAFDKGCFPGQEVIARTQNLGAVKRRMLRFSGIGDAPPGGSALLDASGRTAGIVIRSARVGDDGNELLAVTQIGADTGTLACAASPDRTLRLERLPYAVPGIDD